MEKRLEHDVEKTIEELCLANNVILFQIEGKRSKDKGIPDLLLINSYKKTFFLEAKKDTKTSASQKLFLSMVQSSAEVKEDRQGNIWVIKNKEKIPFTDWLKWFSMGLYNE